MIKWNLTATITTLLFDSQRQTFQTLFVFFFSFFFDKLKILIFINPILVLFFIVRENLNLVNKHCSYFILGVSINIVFCLFYSNFYFCIHWLSKFLNFLYLWITDWMFVHKELIINILFLCTFNIRILFLLLSESAAQLPKSLKYYCPNKYFLICCHICTILVGMYSMNIIIKLCFCDKES